jgi:hypothetical protein
VYITLKPPLPLPSRLENKKDKCSHLVIWTSTLSIIRIQKLFVIGNSICFPNRVFYFYYHKMNLLYSFIISKILVYITLKPPLPLPSRLENKKDKCSHLVIWTSTLSIIRIQKLFVIGN